MKKSVLWTTFFIFTLLIAAYGINEYIQNKKQLYELLEDNAAIVLKSVTIAADNTLLASKQMEDLLKERLLNNAEFIKHLYKDGVINDITLQDFAEKNNLFRINIFDKTGKRIFSNRQPKGRGLRRNLSEHSDLQDILTGKRDTIVIGLRQSRYGINPKYAVAVGTDNGGAIMVNIDAAQLKGLKDSVGFEHLAKSILLKPTIKYFAFQDSVETISSEEYDFDNIQTSDFLKQSLDNKHFVSRITKFKSEDVFEVVQPYFYNGELYGLIRLGFDLSPMNHRLTKSILRIILTLSLTILVGFVILFMSFLKRDLESLKKQYKAVETFSSQIIENVSDAVLVFDEKLRIRTANKSMIQLFGISSDISLIKLEEILGSMFDPVIKSDDNTILKLNSKINAKSFNFLVTKSSFIDEFNRRNTIVFIKDITDITQLNEQIERGERLTALGQLASGVAHEIRNPLNTISTVIQQIKMDFSPMKNDADFQKLTELVYKEVNRIRNSITDFLKFAKPQKPEPIRFSLISFWDEIKIQFETILEKNNIELLIINTYSSDVFWDRNQIKQVFINLIQNSIESINEKESRINNNSDNSSGEEFSEKGKNSIIIISEESGGKILIRVKDSGLGIDEEYITKIFNLYFTTKTKGTGIGLSIVQKIIDEHKGIISVNNFKDKGTEFQINLPKEI